MHRRRQSMTIADVLVPWLRFRSRTNCFIRRWQSKLPVRLIELERVLYSFRIPRGFEVFIAIRRSIRFDLS